jgi:hypothetical protein
MMRENGTSPDLKFRRALRLKAFQPPKLAPWSLRGPKGTSMSKPIEYRVRAVTRYVVTRHDPDHPGATTSQIGEYGAAELAGGVAAALALAERENNGAEAVFIPYEGPPPGKVMRCKVTLSAMQPNVHLVYHETGGRRVPHADGTTPDQTDPMNYVQDGVNVHFNAVWAGQAEDGGNAARENRIFAFASPHVEFRATVRNKDVTDKLEVGRQYYVDFIPAPEPEVA